MSRLPIVLAAPVALQLHQKLVGDLRSFERRGVRPASRPVSVCEAPVLKCSTVFDRQHCLEVVLVDVTMGRAEVPKLGVILDVGNDGNGKLPRHLKPLTSFPPLLNSYLGHHVGVVPRPAIGARVVKRRNKTPLRLGYVVVGEGEVEEGYTSLREEKEPFIRQV